MHLGNAGNAAPDSKLHKANKWAKGAKEVLVEGEVPNQKIGNGGGTSEIRCRG